MQSFYDDFEEFEDFDFAGSATVRRILREQMREEQRQAGRRYPGPGNEDEEDYDDFDEDEFDDFDEDYPYDS